MKLSFHRRVQGEVDEAIEWYEEQSAGLVRGLLSQALYLLTRWIEVIWAIRV